MTDLYKGIAGSPITYLSSGITATQTSISIDNESLLPPAPNIATIGMGENIETIKYGVKSNGVLQEVVRGIEGIPRVWPTGTEVARFFTAYDHNAILENIESHWNDYNSRLGRFGFATDSSERSVSSTTYEQESNLILEMPVKASDILYVEFSGIFWIVPSGKSLISYLVETTGNADNIGGQSYISTSLGNIYDFSGTISSIYVANQDSTLRFATMWKAGGGDSIGYSRYRALRAFVVGKTLG